MSLSFLISFHCCCFLFFLIFFQVILLNLFDLLELLERPNIYSFLIFDFPNICFSHLSILINNISPNNFFTLFSFVLTGPTIARLTSLQISKRLVLRKGFHSHYSGRCSRFLSFTPKLTKSRKICLTSKFLVLSGFLKLSLQDSNLRSTQNS